MSAPENRRELLYLAVLVVLWIVLALYFLGPSVARLAANGAPLEKQERLFRHYERVMSILTPPARPLPALADRLTSGFVQSGERIYYLVYAYAATALLWLQVALAFRRTAICVKARRMRPPPSLNIAWKIVLSIALVSWTVAAAWVLLIVMPLHGNLATMLTYGGVFVPWILLPAYNLLGPSFFALEIWSLRAEGVLPR